MTREEYSPATADTLEKSGWTFAQVPIALFRDHEVSDGAKVLFSYLAWRQGQHSASWPAIGTIASDLDIHEATVRRRIVELEARGWLTVRTRTGSSNVYTIYAEQQPVEPPSTDAIPSTDARGGLQNCKGGVADLQGGGSTTATQNDMNSLDTRTTDKERERRASAPARKHTADVRSKHPAVLLVKGITGRNPPKALYDKVIAIAGDKPDGERAAECYRAWCERGYNPNALTWLTEWYATGIPGRNGNGKGSPAGGLADFDAMIAQFTDGGSNGQH